MNNTTELVFILDKSGSMIGLEKDTIGGFNSLLDKRRKAGDKTLVTTVLFNHTPSFLYVNKDIMTVPEMTEMDYRVGGSTALLDAIGETIGYVTTKIESMGDLRPGHILCVITTDGLENSSREYSFNEIKNLVEAKRRAGWEFIFLGANIDAIEVASRCGIRRTTTANYVSDRKGMDLNFEAINKAVDSFMHGSIDPSWSEDVEKYHDERKK